MLGSADVSALGERGFFVKDGFAGEAAARAALASVRELSLRPAGVGRAQASAPAVRDDRIAWVDDEQLRAPFESLRRELNESAWLGLERFDLQVARYQAGAGYARHRDAFRGGPSRRVTAIWYLNADWRAEDGGLLRLHLDEDAYDVEPRWDRLLVFLSEKLEHEVLTAAAERWAITAWYYGPGITAPEAR